MTQPKRNPTPAETPAQCWYGKGGQHPVCRDAPLSGSDYCKAHLGVAEHCPVYRCPWQGGLCRSHRQEYASAQQSPFPFFSLQDWLATRQNTHAQDLVRNHIQYLDYVRKTWGLVLCKDAWGYEEWRIAK